MSRPPRRSGYSVGHLTGRLSCSLEVVPAFLWLEEIADVAEGSPERLDGSGFGLAQVGLDLGEGLLDRIEIGGIGGQEQEPSASLPQALDCPLALVDGK